MTLPPLLDNLTAPPIVVTNPQVIKYLICQLFTEVSNAKACIQSKQVPVI